MKTTKYFDSIHLREDRALILEDWILKVVENPEKTEIQSDGRIRKWAKIEAMDNRYLRVVLLEDGETIHNAFFDRRYRP